MRIPVKDFEDPAWNTRREELEENLDEALELLIIHMGGGVPVEFPLTVNGVLYTIRMERIEPNRKVN